MMAAKIEKINVILLSVLGILVAAEGLLNFTQMGRAPNTTE